MWHSLAMHVDLGHGDVQATSPGDHIHDLINSIVTSSPGKSLGKFSLIVFFDFLTP